MRRRAVGLAMLLIVFSTSAICAEQLESVGSLDDDPLREWEGIETPTLIYEGVLSDPQDSDNISLIDAPNMVHLIQLVDADEPLKIEVMEDGYIHNQEIGNVTQFLTSSRGNPMWIKISNSDFTSPNSYRILVHSNDADEDVELGNNPISGYVHESDNRGDRVYFETGGNAEIRLNWSGGLDTVFDGYMIHFPSEVVTPLNFSTNEGSMTTYTPAVQSRTEWYEVSITVRTDAVAAHWTISKLIQSQGDSECHHDCPNLIDEGSIQSGAHVIENASAHEKAHVHAITNVSAHGNAHTNMHMHV